MTNIPTGAKYYSEFYSQVTFWNLCFTHYNTVNEEYLQPMHMWQYWDGHHWIDDPTASSRLFRPIDDFIERD